MLQYMKFGQNPSFGLRDRVQTSFFGQNLINQTAGVTLKMRSWSPKSNHFTPPSQCVCASFIKIHPLVQETECRQEATRMLTRSAPKAICAPPLRLGGHNLFTFFFLLEEHLLGWTNNDPEFRAQKWNPWAEILFKPKRVLYCTKSFIITIWNRSEKVEQIQPRNTLTSCRVCQSSSHFHCQQSWDIPHHWWSSCRSTALRHWHRDHTHCLQYRMNDS